MVDRRSEMRTWQNKLYNLQREAPKPFPIECTKILKYVPEQYGSAYHGPLSRQGTEELLDGQPSGAYLIRDSQREDGAYTLAIRFDDSTKNYKLFYDPNTKLHYVGEKKFDSVDLLVADGLIYLYIETRGADILQKLSEASNYEHSPYYRTRYHTVNAVPPKRPPVSAVSGNKIVSSKRQSSFELLRGPNHRNLSNNTIHPPPQNSPLKVTPVSSRQPSTKQHPIEKDSTALTGTNFPIPIDTDEGISNGDVLLTDAIDKTPLMAEEHARSTSLPFGKPSRNDHSKHDATNLATAESSGSSSGHASLKSRQSDKEVFVMDDTDTRRKKFIGGGNEHHRTLAATLPVSLDGHVCPQALTSLPTASAHLAVPGMEKAHNFRVHTFRGPHWCDFCTHFIWGLVSQGVKCTDCGFQAHKRCSISVPNDCLPDMKRLKRVFGVDLTSLVRAENRAVPQVLVKCITELERRGGLMMEGVYRVPGNREIVEDFRIALDKDCESVDLSEKRCSDLNTITSLIKSFLRQLPIPLITYEAYPDLINIAQDEDLSDEQKNDLTKTCIQRLPMAHYYCLRYLMAHLNRVADLKKMNMMSSENLAIVFAPSLMSSSYTDPMSCLAGAKFEQAVINRLIANYATVFEGEDCAPSAPLTSSSASTTTSRSTTASSR